MMRVPSFVMVCSLLVFMTSGSDARSRSYRNGRMVNTVESNDVKEVAMTLGSRENLESLKQEYDAVLINYQKTKYQLQLVQAEYSLLKLQNGRNADSKNKDSSVKSEDAKWCPYATDCYLLETYDACPKKCPENWCKYLLEHNDLNKDCSYKESQERCPTLCAKFSVAEKKVKDAKWCKKAEDSGCKGKRMLKKCPNKCSAIKAKAPEPTAAPAPEPDCIGLSCFGIDNNAEMSDSAVFCDVDSDLLKQLMKIKARKESTSLALVMKIDLDRRLVIMDGIFEDIEDVEDIGELIDELIAKKLPRYVVYSINKKLAFIFINPIGTKPDLRMIYAVNEKKVGIALRIRALEIRSHRDFTKELLYSTMT